MAGEPEFRVVRTWLLANPNATARDIMAQFGCTWSSAQIWHTRWLRNNGLKPPKVPKDPNKISKRPLLRAVRTHVEDLPESKRDEVLRRLSKMYEYIDLLQEKMTEQAATLKASEHVQLANAVRSMVQAAQIHCDHYPGLSALFQGEAQAEATDDDRERLRLVFGDGE